MDAGDALEIAPPPDSVARKGKVKALLPSLDYAMFVVYKSGLILRYTGALSLPLPFPSLQPHCAACVVGGAASSSATGVRSPFALSIP